MAYDHSEGFFFTTTKLYFFQIRGEVGLGSSMENDFQDGVQGSDFSINLTPLKIAK